ncbi:MAG: hypothetical protein IJ392_04885 [Clostridia bacterium]|nr:hypothetical protein [Clostridia bacterium]
MKKLLALLTIVALLFSVTASSVAETDTIAVPAPTKRVSFDSFKECLKIYCSTIDLTPTIHDTIPSGENENEYVSSINFNNTAMSLNVYTDETGTIVRFAGYGGLLSDVDISEAIILPAYALDIAVAAYMPLCYDLDFNLAAVQYNKYWGEALSEKFAALSENAVFDTEMPGGLVNFTEVVTVCQEIELPMDLLISIFKNASTNKITAVNMILFVE